MEIVRNDLETFRELLQVNDARATALFFFLSFFFFTVGRQYKSGVGARGELVKSSESYFEALAKTLKYLQAHWIISGWGPGSRDGNDYDRHSRILA